LKIRLQKFHLNLNFVTRHENSTVREPDLAVSVIRPDPNSRFRTAYNLLTSTVEKVDVIIDDHIRLILVRSASEIDISIHTV